MDSSSHILPTDGFIQIPRNHTADPEYSVLLLIVTIFLLKKRFFLEMYEVVPYIICALNWHII